MAWMYKYIPTICLFLVMYYLTVILVPIHGETLSQSQSQSQTQVEPKPNCQRSSSSGPIIESHKLKRVSGFEHCSPNANRTKTTSSEKLLNRNQTSVRSINKKQKHHHYSSSLSVNGYDQINSDYGSFTVKISLGTPQQNYNLIVDTGSSWTWVRCQSCIQGCSSYDPLYDPLKSSCKAGYLGLGKGEFSLASQSGASMQMFSYFVPDNVGGADINFGDKAREKSNTCSNQFTPLVEGGDQEKYYIDLVGISIDGNELSVPWTEFTSRATIIDSGTVITRLPEVVYSAFRDAFRESMLSYTLLDEADELLDTCYSLEGIEQFVLPEIKFQFGQESTIDVTLSKGGIIWRKSDTINCLAFAATANYKNSIIGIVQQKGFNVLYDLEGERIGFGTNCD